MRGDDRDDRDPFDDLFRELERMMNGMMGGEVDIHAGESGAKAHVDIHEDGETVRVVADLPGVAKEAIDLTCDGKHLTIRAAGNRREYDERVHLPVRVDEHSASATYNNGILEVTFERAADSANIDLD
jgi:HSP20 family protein